MNNIPVPQRGQPITTEWGQQITRAVNSMALRGGNGIVVTSSQNGMTVALANQPHNPQVESPSEYAFKISKVDDAWCICLPRGCLTYGDKIIDVASDLESTNVDARFGSVYQLGTDNPGDVVLKVIAEKTSGDEEDGNGSEEVTCEFSFGNGGGGGDEDEDDRTRRTIAQIVIAHVSSDGKVEQVTKGAVALTLGGDCEGIPIEAGEEGVDVEGKKIYVKVIPPEENEDDPKYIVDLTTESPDKDGKDADDECCNGHSKDDEDIDTDDWSQFEIGAGSGEAHGGGGDGNDQGVGNAWSDDACPKKAND